MSKLYLSELVQLPPSLPPARVEVGLRAALDVSETPLCAVCAVCAVCALRPLISARLDWIGTRTTFGAFGV